MKAEPITDISKCDSGTYRVTTGHGTFYILDMEKKIGIRVPAEGRGELWADKQRWVFDNVFCKLENSMYFEIPKGEGAYTWRVSTPVTSIKELSKSVIRRIEKQLEA